MLACGLARRREPQMASDFMASDFRHPTLAAAWEMVKDHYARECKCGNNGGGDCDACTDAYYAWDHLQATDDDPYTKENTDVRK